MHALAQAMRVFSGGAMLPTWSWVKICLFVCWFTDSGSWGSVALLRMEPALSEGARPSRAGRRVPFRALDTDSSLGRAPGEYALQGSRGPQNGGLGRSCARAELGVCVAVMRSGGLRFVCLVPHRTTPHSRLLNMETLFVALLTGANFLVASQLIRADAAWRPELIVVAVAINRCEK